MTPAEIELYKFAIEEVTRSWVIGCIALAIGIGSISVTKVLERWKQ